MLAALQETGWHNYSRFLREDGTLFSYQDTSPIPAVIHISGTRKSWYDPNGSMITRTVGINTFALVYNAENALVISLLSLLIGILSDAAELRLAFGGVVIVMFILGVVASLVLLRTFPDDAVRQQVVVKSRVA